MFGNRWMSIGTQPQKSNPPLTVDLPAPWNRGNDFKLRARVIMDLDVSMISHALLFNRNGHFKPILVVRRISWVLVWEVHSVWLLPTIKP